jgi:hypothetical protein
LDIALELQDDVVDSHWPENDRLDVDMSTTTFCELDVGDGTLLNAVWVLVTVFVFVVVGELVLVPVLVVLTVVVSCS